MPSGNFTVAMENGPFTWMIDLGNMVGFHSYSKLPQNFHIFSYFPPHLDICIYIYNYIYIYIFIYICIRFSRQPCLIARGYMLCSHSSTNDLVKLLVSGDKSSWLRTGWLWKLMKMPHTLACVYQQVSCTPNQQVALC